MDSKEIFICEEQCKSNLFLLKSNKVYDTVISSDPQGPETLTQHFKNKGKKTLNTIQQYKYKSRLLKTEQSTESFSEIFQADTLTLL